jgi:hypothetical protein
MYTPRTLGGFEVDPLTFYRVVEAIARIDGSTGWCVFIAGGNPLLGAFLADEVAEKVFGSDPQVVTAGVVHPYGTAVLSNGGYRVTGRWSYASGCQHSSWIFCCCQVFDGDQLRLMDDGQPDVRLFFVPSGLVRIVDTWEVSGLAGTGSHDVVIDSGDVRRRDKRPSKQLGHSGHTPLSAAEAVPWHGARLIVGTGAYGRLPVMPELYDEASRRGVEIVALPTAEACDLLDKADRNEVSAILHVTC